jgi:hypothetical protein
MLEWRKMVDDWRGVCPGCGNTMPTAVLYAGIPGRLCQASVHEYPVIMGLLGQLFVWGLPYNGVLIEYTRGYYWRALWHFLRGDHSQSDDDYDGLA